MNISVQEAQVIVALVGTVWARSLFGPIKWYRVSSIDSNGTIWDDNWVLPRPYELKVEDEDD